MAYDEVLSRRTEFAKTFDKGDNKFQLVADINPIHYEDSGFWEDIDMTIVDGKVDKNIYKLELLTDAIGYSAVARKDNSRIDVRLKAIGGIDILYSEPTIDRNIATWVGVSTDVDFSIELLPYRVRCWKKLMNESAAKSITFTVIEDVGEDNILGVVKDTVGYDANNRFTVQSKVLTKEVISISSTTAKEIKTYELTQIFEDKIITRDGETRVKRESTDVTYPVMIDADIEIGVLNGDDGEDYHWYVGSTYTELVANHNYDRVAYYSDAGFFLTSRAFTRFDGITVGLGATIDDATLNVYCCRLGANKTWTILAFDEADPARPTNPGQVRNKSSGVTSASKTFAPNNAAGDTTPSRTAFDLYGVDVATIVQELVNSYSYSSAAMLFFYKTTYTSDWDVGFLYDRDFGSTKAAELIINYTGGVFPGWGHDMNTIAGADIEAVDEIEVANIEEINEI